MNDHRPAPVDDPRVGSRRTIVRSGWRRTDPSTRRRFGRRALWRAIAAAAIAGAAVLVAVVISGGGALFAFALAVSIAILTGVIAGLVLAEREDGRIERMVEGRAEGDRGG